MSTTAPDAADGFMDDVVVPTVKEFLEELGSVRRGMLAALTVSSLADYLFHARPGMRGGAVKVGALRESWAKQCPGFGLVRDVADAAKHVQLDRSSAKLKDVSGVQRTDVILLDGDGAVLLFPIGDEPDPAPLIIDAEVTAVLPDGSRHLLSDCLKEAVLFLQARMGRSPAWPP